MDAPSLPESPVAKLLVGLAERHASGSLTLGDRTLVLAAGEVCEVAGGPADPDLGDFLVDSGRLPPASLAQARAFAAENARSLEESLNARGYLSGSDLRMLKRALWIDRFVRALRLASEREEPLPTLDLASKAAPASGGVALLPFALDVLTRIAVDNDASSVGMSINHRLVWTEGPMTEAARRWAAFSATGDRPVVSTVLARSPAAAPQIAALARAGLVRLEPPGTPGARVKSKTNTLPPPAPRLSIIPEAPRKSVAPTPASLRPPSMPRAPRLRLDPGADGVRIESIPPVELDHAKLQTTPLQDPLRDIELRIAALEAREAPGPERARAFVELARLWQTRIGSLEEAARALREAAAADPSDVHVLQEAALHCSYLGKIELAVAYAQAAIEASGISIERAAAFRLLADIHRASDDMDGCIEALSEAAAEDPSQPESHELLAHLLAERDNLQVAAAHARLAALGWIEHEPKRATMLYAMAYGWNPSDPALSHEYARVLHTLGHGEAAIAVMAETARNLSDVEGRRRMRLAAAQRAEASGRKDLSAELMIEALDDQPSLSLVYVPLDRDLAELGPSAEHAALLEAIATSCPPSDKAKWLARAGEALLEIPGERNNALRLLAGARRLDANTPGLLATLQRKEITPAQLDETSADAAARAKEIEAALLEVTDDAQELTLLAELVGMRAQASDFRGTASAALRVIALEPKHAMAVARLWRAAAALRDSAMTREALTLRARTQSSERGRGRALAALARHLENMGDFDAAVTGAEAALAADTTAADAAIIVLRHAHRMDARRAITLLVQVRALLGDSPPLLFGLAQAALAASDIETHLRTLHEFTELLPFVPDTRLLALEHHLARDVPAAIVEQAEGLLRDAGGPLVVARVREAVARLAELGAHTDAANLAQRVLDEQGRCDPDYAATALQIARASTDNWLITLALERSASSGHDAARLSLLLELASHHVSNQDRVGELRALLRALAVDPACRRAIDDLRTLFAAAGDKHRLLTVLCLDLDATTDPSLRREKLFALVSTTAAFGDQESREQAASYLGALMGESLEERTWLLRALGALFALGDSAWAVEQAKRLAKELPEAVAGMVYLWVAHKVETETEDKTLALALATEGAKLFPSVGELLLMVERITLAAHDTPAAMALYDALLNASIGPHGQRALHYRAGRWLEREGKLEDALKHYAEAFELAKGAGVAYKAIERVARSTGKLSLLIDAQEALAETLRDDDARCVLLQDAARLALNDLDDPARGFRLLMKADELATVGELGAALLDAAHRIGTRDRTAAGAAFEALATTWEQRAEKYWDAEIKTKLLCDAARVHLDERHDPEAGVRSLAMLLVPEVTSNLSTEAQAATLAHYAGALLEAAHYTRARDAVDQALALVPDHAHAQALREELDIAAPLSAQEAKSRSEAPVVPPEAIAVSNETEFSDDSLAAAPETSVAASAPPPSSRPSQAPPRRMDDVELSTASAEENALRARADAGDLEALGTLTTLLAGTPSRREEARFLLGRLVNAEPFRVESLLQLHQEAVAMGARAQAAVSGEILSLFDPRIMGESHHAFHPGLIQQAELRRLLDSQSNADVNRLLVMLWENARAIPRFRRNLDAYDVGPRQRVTPSTESQIATDYIHAARLLSRTDVPLYLKSNAQPGIVLVPTHPASIIVRAELEDDPIMLHRIAQHLVFADAERAVLCALPEQEGRDLFAGMLGAFGPKEASAKLDRSGKELAAVLWHTVPMRQQAQMRDIIAGHLAALDFDRLRKSSLIAAHRAGLLAVAHAGLALEAAANIDPLLHAIDVHTQEGFREACHSSEAFAEIIRTALSEPYLALVAQVM